MRILIEFFKDLMCTILYSPNINSNFYFTYHEYFYNKQRSKEVGENLLTHFPNEQSYPPPPQQILTNHQTC